MKRRSHRFLRLIALFRLGKALLLILSGLAALRLLRPGAIDAVTEWIDAFPFASQHAFVQRAVALVTRQPLHRIRELAVAFFLYAALFITEGVGLWLEKVWAEWLTIVATISFIPFEVYEVVHKVTVFRVTVLVLNLAIVAYLIHLRRPVK